MAVVSAGTKGAEPSLPAPLESLVGVEVMPNPVLHAPEEPQPRPWHQLFRCDNCVYEEKKDKDA